MSTDERRQSPRILYRTLVSYTGVDRNGRRTSGGTGYSVNFGNNGMLIETNAEIETDVVGFVMMDMKGQVLSSTGRVVHRFRDEAGRYFTGINFLKDYDII